MSELEYVTYEEWGRKFFEVAVSEERVAAAFASVAGEEFAMGPIAQGPAKIARVSAKVKIQPPNVTRAFGEMISFSVSIPLDIALVVDLRLDKQRFNVTGEIKLTATVRAAEPLLIYIDIPKPRSRDITVNVTSTTIRGEVLRIVGDVDAEIRRFIARDVGARVDHPESQKAKIIDVASEIGNAWRGV
jgi:hypothetical protein